MTLLGFQLRVGPLRLQALPDLCPTPKTLLQT